MTDQPQPCKHPPERYYTGSYTCFDADCQPYERWWVGCCQCGEIVADFVSPFEKNKNRTIHPDIIKDIFPERTTEHV